MSASDSTFPQDSTPIINAIWLSVIVQFIVFPVIVPIAVLNFVVIFQTSVNHFTIIYDSEESAKARKFILIYFRLFTAI